jgi:transcriptional regulator with XRE-family HTH domain
MSANAAERDIIARLVAVRRSRGLKQADVARRMYVCRGMIAKFEAGSHSPTLATLLRYAAAVGADLRVGAVELESV